MSTRSKTSSRPRTQSMIELEPGELDFPAVEAGERFARRRKGTLLEDSVVVAVCVVMLGGRRRYLGTNGMARPMRGVHPVEMMLGLLLRWA
jgi:hypothetical protein